MNKDELREQVNTLINKLEEQDTGHGFAIRSTESYTALETFACALVVRGMEEVKERCSFMAKHYHETRSTDLLMRSTQYNEMIGLSNWIDTEIQRIKADHE
jgi:hypothetical protein